MFGYIKPYKPELKLKDINRYSNAYCSLCNQLKVDYGPLGRFILNYDITFLLLFIDCYYDDKNEKKVRCPYNPLRVHKTCFSKRSLEFASFVNYWLVVEKIADDSKDEKSVFKKLLKKFLVSKRRFKKQLLKYDKHIEKLSKLLNEVYEKETEISNEADFDDVTNKFGEFFSEIFLATEIKKIKNFKSLLFQLGKWIYIIDAYDDFTKDMKKGRTNILLIFGDENKFTTKDAYEVAASLHCLLKSKMLDLLKDSDVKISDACIINIFEYGIDSVFYQITKKKYKEFLGKGNNYGISNIEQLGAIEKRPFKRND